ncbi:retinoic acid receptor RXR-alpha [Crotalus adamanteus]|uniref:Retinoic acid receptor RXR-alpha n=1 Tax=Crotalus adamanteus TaxID=8729 RepID=A0AAW1AS11_CROAD
MSEGEMLYKCSLFLHIFTDALAAGLTYFSVQVNSTSLSSPAGRGGPMATPALHPSMGPSLGGPLGSPSQLHSPINGMGPPFSVISSPMGPHAMSGPSTPSLGFGAGSPQRKCALAEDDEGGCVNGGLLQCAQAAAPWLPTLKQLVQVPTVRPPPEWGRGPRGLGSAGGPGGPFLPWDVAGPAGQAELRVMFSRAETLPCRVRAGCPLCLAR